jgi:putative transposase
MIERFRREDARILEQLVGPHGRALFWQRGGGYDRNLRSSSDIREKIEYIHQNPVRRGLVVNPSDWVWSSARDYAGEIGIVPLRRDW